MSYPPPRPTPYGSYGPPPNHRSATTALVLGILGVVCCPIFGPFAWSIGKKAVDEIDGSSGGSVDAGWLRPAISSGSSAPCS